MDSSVMLSPLWGPPDGPDLPLVLTAWQTYASTVDSPLCKQSTRQLHSCCLMAHAGVWLRPPAVAGRQCAAEPCSRQSSSLGTSTTGHSRLSWQCKATRGGSAESLQFTDAAEETRVAMRAPQHDYTYPARLLSKNQVPPRCCHGRAHLSVCAYQSALPAIGDGCAGGGRSSKQPHIPVVLLL
jgi:hypothetical protein